jgi:hypothetical protein
MTLMYINVINVAYTYIILRTIKPTYLMTVYCLCGAAPIGLIFKQIHFNDPEYNLRGSTLRSCLWIFKIGP